MKTVMLGSHVFVAIPAFDSIILIDPSKPNVLALLHSVLPHFQQDFSCLLHLSFLQAGQTWLLIAGAVQL